MSCLIFAMLGVMPVAEAAHNANLFVSAENSQFSNYFAGPQVIEVVVNDNDIRTLDDDHGEPDVTVNGKKIRMAQATDGSWYGYFADKLQATTADATQAAGSTFGLDFGKFCKADTVLGNATFSQTVGIAVRGDPGSGTDGTTAFVTCTNGPGGSSEQHVVRENKTLNAGAPSSGLGQISLEDNVFPVIQLYDFSVGGNVIVKYNKGGGAQTTTLTFDTIPSNLVTYALDRVIYPRNAEVHVTLTDPQLNIDPTDEDSWTWDPSNGTAFYQAFDKNGSNDANGGPGLVDLTGSLATLMFDKNGIVTVNLAEQGGDNIAEFDTNNDQPFLFLNDGSTTYPQMITFVELLPSSGVFTNYDENNDANLDITLDAERGKSATIKYNDVTRSALVGFGFAVVDINVPDGEWNSGEEISVTLTDFDANKNSREDEDLNLFNPDVETLPTLQIGDPITLEFASNVNFYTTSTDALGGGTLVSSTIADNVSDILRINNTATPPGAFEKITIDLGITAENLHFLFADTSNPNTGINLINFDLRSFNQQLGIINFSDTSMSLHFGGLPGTTIVPIIDAGDISAGRGLVQIDNVDIITIDAVSNSSPVFLEINFDASNDTPDTGIIANQTHIQPIAFDLFSFGDQNGVGVQNAVYRFELEETADNTSTFVGTAEFTMLNQLNIRDNNLYKSLHTIDNEVTFIVHNKLDGVNSPRVTYNDLGADGSINPVADQQAAPTHSGVVSFDKSTYKLGDTVSITLKDKDLNVDVDLIDVYTTVASSTDPASDAIGEAGLGIYNNGDSFGSLLDITFGNMRWVNGTINPVSTCGGLPAGETSTNGLTASGFTLVETSTDSNIFKGDFLLPNVFCYTNVTPSPYAPVKGLDIHVNYIDFRDDSGQKIEVNDNAIITTISDPYRILFKSGARTPIPDKEINAIKGPSSPDDLVHFLIQFENIPNSAVKNNLGTNGINLLHYITGNTYIASAKVTALDNLSTMPEVRWAGPYLSDDKIEPDLKIGNVGNWAKTSNNQTVLTIQFHKDVTLQEAMDLVTHSLGGNIISTVSMIPSITASFDPGKEFDIAKKDLVQYVDVVGLPLRETNDGARDASNITPLRLTQSHLTGKGVTVLVYDSTAVNTTMHPDFGDRIIETELPPTPPPPQQPDRRHALHVIGILGGSGINSNGSPSETWITSPGGQPFQWTGMAPAVKIKSYSLDGSTDFIYDTAGDMEDDFERALDSNTQIVTMSLNTNIFDRGADCALLGKYSHTARVVDMIVRGKYVDIANKKPIFFESVGNERGFGFFGGLARCGNFATISSPATAKNSIAVGATNSSDHSLAFMTSFGPTIDGRLKPDITAPGCQKGGDGGITSTGLNHVYRVTCGTSQATPVAAGATALMIQQWKADRATLPPNHTVKAILIHTATDRGNPGPDYKYGWGTLNAKAAVDLVIKDKTKHVIRADRVDNDKTLFYTFNSDGSNDVQVTLAWDDPEATTTATTTLINNLDLKIKDPDGRDYWPYLLAEVPDNFLSPATSANDEIFNGTVSFGVDTRNNVEMIRGNAKAGEWIVYVSGQREMLEAPQEFTLIVPDTILESGSFANNVGSDSTPPTNYFPSITSTQITAASIGISYSYNVDASDPNAGDALSFSLVQKPSGMTINPASGMISWTPTVSQVGSHSIIVKVTDSGGLDDTQSFIITVSDAPTVPNPPTGLTATSPSTLQNDLSWSAPAYDGGSAITGYKIERSDDDRSTWSTISSNTDSTVTTYSDTNVVASTTYTYKVSAINSIGESSPSNEIVIPEFGTIATLVLAISIVSIIVITSKSRIISRL